MPVLRSKFAGLLLVGVYSATACGSSNASVIDSPGIKPAVVETTVGGTEATVPSAASEVVAVAEVHQHFEYYGACGNETTVVGATTYYPLFHGEQTAFDVSRYPVEPVESSPSASVTQGLRRVAAPGPGDDIGAMVVYTDGMARYESESGRVIWLTTEEHTYNWVC